MRRLEFPSGTRDGKLWGGSYNDALWSGEFIQTYWDDNSKVTTHLGDIPTQDGVKPGFPRISDVGGFKFAGQANIGGDTIEYVGGVWKHIPVVPCGVSPVIYDLTGTLQINVNCKWGSNGARYIDPYNGRIVTGDETYGSTFGLSEWTDIGSEIYIGQSNIEPGVGVFIGGVLRQLTTGFPCQFVRASRFQNQVAVTCIQNKGGPSLIIWATLAELAALPLAKESVPVPVPVPIPIPIPTEDISFMALDPIYHFGKNDIGGGKFTLTANLATGEVWSVPPDGSLQTRPKGTAKEWETFSQVGQAVVVNSFGKYHAFYPVDVRGV